MMSHFKNRRGIAPLLIVLIVLVVIYLFTFLPFTGLKVFRGAINFYFIIILWIGIQAVILYVYYELAMFGYQLYKKFIVKLVKYSTNLRTKTILNMR
jgi:Zn-dependent protease with chaperone function